MDRGLEFSDNVILRISKYVEDLSFNMLNTIGVLILVICTLLFACDIIGKVNQDTIDLGNYVLFGFFEMLIMCYFPHRMRERGICP